MAEEKQAGPPKAQVSSKRYRIRKRLLIRLTLLLIVIGIIYFIYWLFIGQFYETTDDAYVNGNLVQVMPRVSGHVIAILADETGFVKKEQPLVKLDPTDYEITLKNAESQLDAAVRQVKSLYTEIDELRANLKLKQDILTQAQGDLKRRQGLDVNKVITQEELQHTQIAAKTAADDVNFAQNQLNAAINQVIHTDLYHHPVVQQAANKVKNAYLDLMRTVIYSPETGYIAKRTVEMGEQVTPSTILMVIVPLNQVWINANFKESQLKYFRAGQKVSATSDLYGSSVVYHGEVQGLSPGTGTTFDLLPPQNATGNWIKIIQRLPVRIILNDQQLQKYPLRIGLSMSVTVDTHHREGPILTMVSQKPIAYESVINQQQIKAADKRVQQIIEAITPNMRVSQ